MKINPIRDLRQYSRQTYFRLIVGGLLVLLFIGDGLIYYFYGGEAAIAGVICIFLGLVPVIGIGLFLLIIEWIVHRANQE